MRLVSRQDLGCARAGPLTETITALLRKDPALRLTAEQVATALAEFAFTWIEDEPVDT
ncbi:hypothetical protein [Thermomonospora umbrina]|uniref:hypothetical protein n=1 Tax=Thermomonospora umbrina TaxID=111806 RepID=UPI00147741E9|nr:hypothetical protein [Thermomonospora umbrina]